MNPPQSVELARASPHALLNGYNIDGHSPGFMDPDHRPDEKPAPERRPSISGAVSDRASFGCLWRPKMDTLSGDFRLELRILPRIVCYRRAERKLCPKHLPPPSPSEVVTLQRGGPYSKVFPSRFSFWPALGASGSGSPRNCTFPNCGPRNLAAAGPFF